MTRIWLVNWHFQSRITLWCRHKSANVSMGLCWQMPKFIVWRLWSIYFDHHLPLKPSIGKRWKQSCTCNIKNVHSNKFIQICIETDLSIVLCTPDRQKIVKTNKHSHLNSLYLFSISYIGDLFFLSIISLYTTIYSILQVKVIHNYLKYRWIINYKLP